MSINDIPDWGKGLLEALQFKNRDCSRLANLAAGEWRNLLALSDSTQVTLLLGHHAKASLPDAVRARIEKNGVDNAYRFQTLMKAVNEIATRFAGCSIDFRILKGFAHSPELTPDPLLRAQGDIDLWCLPDQIERAKDELLELGYRPAAKSKGRHLDPMIRPSEWEWRGDYFARDLPIPIDLHFTLWDEKLEFIAGPDEQALWQRCVTTVYEGQTITRLDLADTLTFAVLHFMMHLLHGDLRLQRIWEIAYFLEERSTDTDFWLRWQTLYSPEILQMQAIAFELARKWFGCDLSPIALAQVRALPEDIQLWLKKYGFSPIRGLFIPNKDEVWLNLCLLKSRRQKARVLFRRLLPTPHLPAQAAGGSRQFLWKRCAHHLRTFHSTCLTGLEWSLARLQIGHSFLTFLVVSVLFDFGEFIFFLLYNLYLLEHGFDEKFIGQVSASLTAGTFAGVIPGSEIVRRIGLRNFVMLAVVGSALAAVVRSFASSHYLLLGSAFANGVFLSFWAVSLPPSVANLTGERHRTLAFSVISAVGIGIGAMAALFGGHLPSTLISLAPTLNSLESKRASLLAGSALAACAIFPALFLRFSTTTPTKQLSKRYPSGPFIRAFLAALFLWTLGTGGFNPFFSVFFSKRLHATVAQIGLVSSYSQLGQVAAILLAPAVLQKAGMIKGIAAIQLATAVSLALLAFASNYGMSALLFVAYMSFQYMSEPCLLSMLMTRVDQSERGGASMLNFLTTSLAGSFAATIAGYAISASGYRATLLILASVIALSAVIFRLIVC